MLSENELETSKLHFLKYAGSVIEVCVPAQHLTHKS